MGEPVVQPAMMERGNKYFLTKDQQQEHPYLLQSKIPDFNDPSKEYILLFRLQDYQSYLIKKEEFSTQFSPARLYS